jgi:hypothetical protein
MYVIFGLGLFFVGMAFILTEKMQSICCQATIP